MCGRVLKNISQIPKFSITFSIGPWQVFYAISSCANPQKQHIVQYEKKLPGIGQWAINLFTPPMMKHKISLLNIKISG